MQDWTKQENEDAEGVVSFSYRTKPEEPPDVQTIQKQMAIVAWQPGPNRIVQVPSQVNCPLLSFCSHSGEVHLIYHGPSCCWHPATGGASSSIAPPRVVLQSWHSPADSVCWTF